MNTHPDSNSETNVQSTEQTSEQEISPNILLMNLKTIFSDSKDKFSCEQIQEVMNLLCDLEQEIFTLQTNLSKANTQHNLVNMINQNVHTIVEKLGQNNSSPESSNNSSEKTQEQQAFNLDSMAEQISGLVVQKLQELDDDDSQ